MGFILDAPPDAHVYPTAEALRVSAKASNAIERAGRYKVTQADLNDPANETPLPGAEHRGAATALAATGHSMDAPAPAAAKTGFTPDVPPAVDPIAKANQDAAASEHGPAQDIIDMVKAIPSGLLPALHAMVSSVARHVANPSTIISEPQEALRNFAADPSAPLAALRNATGTQAGQNVIAPALVAGGVTGGLAGAAKGVEALITGRAINAANTAAAAEYAPLGLRTADQHQVAAGTTGLEGQAVLGHQNTAVATRVAGNQVGVPTDVPVNPTSLAAARVAPGAVLDRAADALPTAQLSPAAQAMVMNAQDAGRILKGTPNVEAQVGDAATRLLGKPGEEPPQFSGQQIKAERAALRAEVNAGMNSTDADQRAIASYKNKIVQALDQHTTDTMLPGGPTTPEQVQLARATMAQNYTVGDLMNGPYLNLKGLGKLHNDNPSLLTGDLKTLGQFALDHPEVSKLPESEYQFAKPGVQADIGGAIGTGGGDIGSRISKGLGVQALARRVLAGPEGEAMKAASARPVTGLGGEFDPIQASQLPMQPTPGTIGAPPSRQGTLLPDNLTVQPFPETPRPDLTLGQPPGTVLGQPAQYQRPLSHPPQVGPQQHDITFPQPGEAPEQLDLLKFAKKLGLGDIFK